MPSGNHSALTLDCKSEMKGGGDAENSSRRLYVYPPLRRGASHPAGLVVRKLTSLRLCPLSRPVAILGEYARNNAVVGRRWARQSTLLTLTFTVSMLGGKVSGYDL